MATPPAERTRKGSFTKRASNKVRHLLQRTKTRAKSNSISRHGPGKEEEGEQDPRSRRRGNKTDTSTESSGESTSDHDGKKSNASSVSSSHHPPPPTHVQPTSSSSSSSGGGKSSGRKELPAAPPPLSSVSVSAAAAAAPMASSVVVVDLQRDADGGVEPIMNSHANLAQETYDVNESQPTPPTPADDETAPAAEHNDDDDDNAATRACEPSPTIAPIPYELDEKHLDRIESIPPAQSADNDHDDETSRSAVREEGAASAVVVRAVAYDVAVQRQHERTGIVRTLSSLRTMGYHWPVAFSAALIIHLGIPFRLRWHSLAGWIQSHGRYRDSVRGLSLGDGFRAVSAMEVQSRLRWWHIKTQLVHRLQWLLTFTILHDPTLHMVTLPALQRLGAQ